MSENNGKTKVAEIIKSNKKIYYAVAGIMVIILVLVLFGGFFSESSKKETSDSVSDYVAGLEERLTNSLKNVEGVGKVSVVINVESGMETVLATKVTVTENGGVKETVETPIIINGKPVVLKEMFPKITGVLIVAEGAGSISVLRRIQQATVSLLDINVNDIEILTMK